MRCIEHTTIANNGMSGPRGPWLAPRRNTHLPNAHPAVRVSNRDAVNKDVRDVAVVLLQHEKVKPYDTGRKIENEPTLPSLLSSSHLKQILNLHG